MPQVSSGAESVDRSDLLGVPVHALVIDDDDVDREKLKRLLKRCRPGVNVAEANSKVSALAELRGQTKNFSFIFLDFKLDDGDGRDLLPDIWQLVGSDCVVIAVTGYGSDRAAADAIKLGIHEYLSKNELTGERVAVAIRDGLDWIEEHQRARVVEQELIHRSLHDALTDLPNRHLFLDRIEYHCAQQRRDGHAFALLMIDLDRFKQVNDEFGHLLGDELLVEVGRRLREGVREVDTAARLGGDEFAVLLPGVATLDVAEAVGRKLVGALQAPMALSCGPLSIAASIGVVVAPQHGHDVNTLLARADQAMYRAKRNLDKVMLYDDLEPGSTNILDRMVLMGEMELALERGDIQWYLQPKVDLVALRPTGFEALARWHHSRFGPIAPDAFITAIEGSKLIWPFTLATIDAALGHLQRLGPTHAHLSISVNVSARVLQQPGLVEHVIQKLDSAAIDPRRLVLELTETALISNPAQARKVLDELAAHGIDLSIDDFGAGFTSFGYLRDFMVREIKIDKSYILNLTERSFDQSLVTCLAVFCEAQGLRLVAEGVETPECLARLLELGCRYGQGYGIGRPMTIDAVQTWIVEQEAGAGHDDLGPPHDD